MNNATTDTTTLDSVTLYIVTPREGSRFESYCAPTRGLATAYAAEQRALGWSARITPEVCPVSDWNAEVSRVAA